MRLTRTNESIRRFFGEGCRTGAETSCCALVAHQQGNTGESRIPIIEALYPPFQTAIRLRSDQLLASTRTECRHDAAINLWTSLCAAVHRGLQCIMGAAADRREDS